jgi:hypothetical protein
MKKLQFKKGDVVIYQGNERVVKQFPYELVMGEIGVLLEPSAPDKQRGLSGIAAHIDQLGIGATIELMASAQVPPPADDSHEIQKREVAARAAIKRAFNPADEESEVALFVSHHLKELDSAYWQKHFSTAKPDSQSILDSLVLQSHWGGDDELKTFDFTLPDDATNYLISVSFDEDGDVSGISMES